MHDRTHIPDEGLQAFCADVDEFGDVQMPGRKFSIKFMRRLAGEVLALRAWVRKALPVGDELQVYLESDLGESETDPWPGLADEARALLPPS
jgi:hypothetical protein